MNEFVILNHVGVTETHDGDLVTYQFVGVDENDVFYVSTFSLKLQYKESFEKYLSRLIPVNVARKENEECQTEH